MNTDLPSVETVQAKLKRLKGAELEALADSSGVPASTLWKIRNGFTPNPGLETVRKFYRLLPDASAQVQGAANA
jgi:predicted transcriptional regulator